MEFLESRKVRNPDIGQTLLSDTDEIKFVSYGSFQIMFWWQAAAQYWSQCARAGGRAGCRKWSGAVAFRSHRGRQQISTSRERGQHQQDDAPVPLDVQGRARVPGSGWRHRRAPVPFCVLRYTEGAL